MRRYVLSVARRVIAVTLAAVAVLVFTACGATQRSDSLTEVSVALGWTPNTDHTGVYVADKLGYFKREGISLKILPYANTAPETLVANGVADFGFAYQAGVVYARAAGGDVTSVFAPTQKGTYAIGVRADRADINSPKDLDGKTYAGFGSPDELPELRYVIHNAGGVGNFTNVTLNTSVYDAVHSGRADFAICVLTWQVIQAKLENRPLKTFKLTDYGFPEQYSNLIASSRQYLDENPDLARKFLVAVTDGYRYAAEHPQEAAKLLIEANPTAFANPQLVYESQNVLAAEGYLRNANGQVGTHDPAIWQAYGKFLYDNGLLVDNTGAKLSNEPNWAEYYTNEFLPAGSQ